MSSTKKQNLPCNGARRHFLGVVAAITAAGIVVTLPAHAKGSNWWEKHGNGDHPGRGPKDDGPNCFLRGTSIMTPTGEARIEDLQIGDLVETVRGEAMAVKWIGRQHYKKRGPSWPDSVMPIRVARHALDQQTPDRDLYLSPNHALYIDGVLIRAKDLVNGISIAPALPAGRDVIEYFHIVLDTHEAILAEGAPAETCLLRAGDHENFINFPEYERLYPGGAPLAMTPFAPIVGYDGGREHLKALLRLGASCFVRVGDPIQDAYWRIAARAESVAC